MRTSDQLKGHNLDNSSKHDEIVMWLYDGLKDRGWFDLMVQNFIKYEILKIESINIEFPYAGGFVDLACCVKVSSTYQIEEEFIIDGKKEKKWIDHKSERDLLILFEVKTEIKLGETIRQINYYESRTKRFNWELAPIWFVVAPGNKYENVLKEQGVHYIEYKK